MANLLATSITKNLFVQRPGITLQIIKRYIVDKPPVDPPTFEGGNQGDDDRNGKFISYYMCNLEMFGNNT